MTGASLFSALRTGQTDVEGGVGLTGVQELSTQMAQSLREMIAARNMKPGDKFPSERELMEQFNVSRSTAREAVKLLVAENLVEVRRGKGTYITRRPGLIKDPLGLRYVGGSQVLQNLMEARILIEPPIAALAALRAQPEDIQRLEKILYKQISNMDPALHEGMDVDFHTALAQCTHNDVLHRLLPVIREGIQEGRGETEGLPGSWENALSWHVRIFRAAQCGDAQAARQAMLGHLMRTAEEANIKIDLGGHDG